MNTKDETIAFYSRLPETYKDIPFHYQNWTVIRHKDKYTIVFLILIAIEVLIALYVHDAFIRPYIGDVMVVMVLYVAFRAFKPEGVKFLPLYIFLFAALVECLQFFNLIQILNVESNTFLSVVIGSVFDINDILCYGIGSILLGIFEWKIKRKMRL